MKTICIDDVKNCIYNPKMMGTADLYDCSIDDEEYVFKKFDFDSTLACKLEKLSKLEDYHFIFPEILIKGIREQYVGYLSKPFYQSHTFFDLSKYETSQRLKLLREARKLVLKMHSMGITHVDLHPGNMLFRNDTVKFCDFDDCEYSGFKSPHSNAYSQKYLLQNPMSPSIDIFNFNISSMSILYSVRWDETINYDFTFLDKLNDEQKIIWEKVKKYETLSKDDFIVNHY